MSEAERGTALTRRAEAAASRYPLKDFVSALQSEPWTLSLDPPPPDDTLGEDVARALQEARCALQSGTVRIDTSENCPDTGEEMLSVFQVSANRMVAEIDADLDGQAIRITRTHEDQQVDVSTWRDLCTTDPARVLEWIDNRLEPHGVSDASILLELLELLELDVRVAFESRPVPGIPIGSILPHERVEVHLTAGSCSRRFLGRTWRSIHRETRAFGGLLVSGLIADPMTHHRPDTTPWAAEDVRLVEALAALLLQCHGDDRHAHLGDTRRRSATRAERFAHATRALRRVG